MSRTKLPSFDLLFRRWLKKEKICFKHYQATVNEHNGVIRVGAHMLGWIEGLNFCSEYDVEGKHHPFAERPLAILNASDPDFFDKVKRHLRISVRGLAEYLKEVEETWDKDVVKAYHTEG